jgi:serine/threonine protein kinase
VIDATNDQSHFGTPEYLSPEYYKFGKHNKSDDWWAFGCLLYELT